MGKASAGKTLAQYKPACWHLPYASHHLSHTLRLSTTSLDASGVLRQQTALVCAWRQKKRFTPDQPTCSLGADINSYWLVCESQALICKTSRYQTSQQVQGSLSFMTLLIAPEGVSQVSPWKLIFLRKLPTLVNTHLWRPKGPFGDQKGVLA